MSRTLLTGEKKIRDTMASLLLSERALYLYPDIDWLKTLYDLWLQGTFINFREEEIFIFGAWVYTIMRLSTPTLFAN
jgi:hypothetical protein